MGLGGFWFSTLLYYTVLTICTLILAFGKALVQGTRESYSFMPAVAMPTSRAFIRRRAFATFFIRIGLGHKALQNLPPDAFLFFYSDLFFLLKRSDKADISYNFLFSSLFNAASSSVESLRFRAVLWGPEAQRVSLLRKQLAFLHYVVVSDIISLITRRELIYFKDYSRSFSIRGFEEFVTALLQLQLVQFFFLPIPGSWPDFGLAFLSDLTIDLSDS